MMNASRKLSLMRAGRLVIAVVTMDNEQRVLVNGEASEILRELRRLLGLRRCSICGRWVRPEDLGYVEVMDNKVVKTVCHECLDKAYSNVAALMSQCLPNKYAGPLT